MKNTTPAIAAAFALLAPFANATDDITCARFPDADTVIVDDVERVKYNPDGTYETTEEIWTRILTEKGRREAGTVTLEYSKRYGEAAVEYVGAIGSDGREREIDVSATTKEQTDNGSMSANIYDPLDRVIVCTVPGLKIGETLHVKTRRKTTNPRCQDNWSDISVMEWTQPILRASYEVTAPAERPLGRIAVRNPLGNMTTNATRLADGSTLHTFVCTNSPQAFAEPDMPPLYTQVQNVRVSTARDWPEISKWYWKLCEPHLAKTNAAMVAKVEELGRDMRKIFTFVSQEIRYMGLTMEDVSPGCSPHDVDITFDNRYGVCRDKAALLVAMLRLAGFDAFPVLIHAGAKLDPEVPQPFFNHAIAAVAMGKEEVRSKKEEGIGVEEKEEGRRKKEEERSEYILMDPTDENAKEMLPPYLCNKSHLVCRPEGDVLRTTEVPSPKDNSVDIESHGTIAPDGSMFLEGKLRFGGINDTAYRHALVRRTPTDRRGIFERALKAVAPGAELVKCDISPRDMRDTDSPLEVSVSAQIPEAVVRGVSRDSVNVPFLSGALGMANFILAGSTSLDHRRFPLSIDSTAQTAERIVIDLGESIGKPLDIPEEQRIDSEGYSFRRLFTATGGVLSAERTLTIGAVEFSPKAYQDLREAIKGAEAASRKRPVFSKNPNDGANVRHILESTEATVFSDREWVVTNTVVKEVITYQGKKTSAEVKIAYNPAVETIGFLYATVSNRDGVVRSVSRHELSVMDCGWAAAAPRYPASRLLVANLPSVEIGSVISYSTVRAVTNAPLPFYAAYSFDSAEPLEKRVVRVNDWRKEAVSPKRIPREKNQPPASAWRDHEIVSSNRFEKMDLRIGDADPAAMLAGAEATDDESRIRAIRDWMAKNVKRNGPGMYEVPLAMQLTPPDVVLGERYATRLDYIRTMCALLRGAGLDADVVLAADDADDPATVRDRIMRRKPDVGAFSNPLCRVVVRKGGFLGFGASERTYFVGTESQYAPLGPSAFEGADFFDPSSGGFGIVTVPDSSFSPMTVESADYDIRADGSVDLVVANEFYGPSAGVFRKKYSEMLPEIRWRRYQEMLGKVSQAATATGDLVTDVSSYPARMSFSCFIPNFATVQGDAVTIRLPPLIAPFPLLEGSARSTPVEIGSCNRSVETVTVKFPDGYSIAENVPESFSFADPSDAAKTWMSCNVVSEVRDGRLVVTIRRDVSRRNDSWHGPEMYELFKDWRRRASSAASRTITARRR